MGKVAFLSHYGNAVLAVDLATKKTQWSYSETDFPYFSSPAVTEKFVLAGDRGKRMHCIDRTSGDEVWYFRATGKIDSSPVVTGSSVCFGSDDGRIYAVNLADGKERWNYEIGPSVQTSPCVAGGRLVMGADDGVIYCFGGKIITFAFENSLLDSFLSLVTGLSYFFGCSPVTPPSHG